MEDSFGRVIDYVRVSVTDRCNLRCGYCMPKEGVTSVPHGEILTLEEITRICSILAELGTKRIKISGGEPLVRGGLIPFIGELKKIDGIEQVTLTTNGLNLEKNLPALISAGVERINVSLDTLKPEVFERITGSGGHDKVLSAINACVKCRMPVRVNCVPIAGVNDEELLSIAALAKDKAIDVRFIELMPVGLAAKYEYTPSETIMEALSEAYGLLSPCSGVCGNGPARYYTLDGFIGRIGFISAMSHVFCEQCNRIRLTSEGRLVLCLSHEISADLKTPLRGGASDSELAAIITEAVRQKPSAHGFHKEAQKAMMNSIGG